MSILSAIILISLPSASSENIFPVRISEVQMNPDGSDTGAEFVELVNITNETQAIGGWDIDAADLPYFTIPQATQIAPLSTLTIYFRKDGINTAETIFTGATFGSTNMKNTNGAVALFTSQTHVAATLMDYVEYGASAQIHETIAIEKGIWQQNLYVPVSGTEGWSIMRTCRSNTNTICWNYGSATPGVHTLQDNPAVSNQNINPEMNQNISTGSVLPVATVFIDETIFAEDTFSSENPIDLQILTSSGAVLHLDEGNGFYEITSGQFRVQIEEEGTYMFSYFLNNDESSLKSITLTYFKPVPLLYPYINELSFNPSDGKKDFLELYFSPSGSSFSSLRGFSLQIDQTAIPLDDTPIASDGYALISFGGARTEMDPTLQKIVTAPSSLVGTTEQITLMYQGTPVDGVCWETLPIASTERSDYDSFTGIHGLWNGACVDAKVVTSGKSLMRKEKGSYPSEGNTKDLWEVIPLETPGSPNVIPHSSPIVNMQIQGDGKVSGAVPFHLNLTGEGSSDIYGIESYLWDFGDGTVSAEMNPTDHIYSIAGSYTVSLKVTNVLGDTATKTIHIDVLPVSSGGTSGNIQTIPNNVCSSSIETNVILSEIFPNPKGVDTGAEWIEIYNPTNEHITFCDIFLDDEEGGSMPVSLKGRQISSQSYLILSDIDTKITLGNTSDAVRLLYGSEKEVVDMVTYKDAKEGMSYSRF
ncbi:MAG: lamin tail domain-containing protein [Candidatus Gracilibacteria bacterium]